MEDWCLLCSIPLSKHYVLTEETTVNGKKVVKPIGWGCPKNE